MKAYSRIIVISAVALSTTACATNQEYLAQIKAQERIAVAQAKEPAPQILVLEAHEGQEIRLQGVKRLVVSAPKQAAAQPVNVAAPPESAWRSVERVAITALGVAGQTAQVGLVVGGVKALGDNIERGSTAGYATVQGNTNIQHTTTSLVGGDGTAGGGIASKQTETTLTSTTTSDSNNVSGSYNPVSTTTDNHAVTGN